MMIHLLTLEVIMLKTPRFLLTASLALALVFTFSCSGDDGDSPPATLPSSSDAGVSQLPSSTSAPSSSSEDATLHSSSSHDEELVEVSSSSEEESSSSAAPPPYIPPVVPSSSSSEHSSSSLEHCSHFIEGTEIEHYGMLKKKFCDKRDGHEYVYVEIGTQTWMAENLNYAAEGSKCYDDDEEHCKTYGRLYDWRTAMELPYDEGCTDFAACGSQVKSPTHRGICPEGWHIPPATGGWTALRDYIASIQNISNTSVGYALKAKSDLWKTGSQGIYTYPYTNNTDDYGFSALPAGFYETTPGIGAIEGYDGLGFHARWWMASISASNGAVSHQAVTTANVSQSGSNNSNTWYRLYSVRCMKDD
jgi:uncharacterized protein (TIGR02145 family)